MHLLVRNPMPFAQYARLACSNVCLIPTITMLTQVIQSLSHAHSSEDPTRFHLSDTCARDEERKYNSTRFGLFDRSFCLPKRKKEERRGADYR